MKKVISVHVDGKFHQYLMKSEVRFLIDIMKAFEDKEVTIYLTDLTQSEYKRFFGK